RPPAAIVDDPARLGEVIAECRRASIIALDVETSSLDPMRSEVIGFSLAVAPGRSWYLPFAHVAPAGELAGDAPPKNLPPLGTELRTYADLAGKGRTERPFAAVPVAAAGRYCCDDSETVLRLRDAFAAELEDHKLRPLLEGIEVPLLAVLVDMEWTGVLVDRELLATLSRQFATELGELERAI